MKLNKIENVDLIAYKAQTNVRRRRTPTTLYKNIAIMTDADTDG